MIGKERIGPGEAVSMAVVFITAKVFLTFPSTMVDLGMSAAWMVTLLAVLLGVAAFFPVAVLLERFPGKSVVEIGEELVGPYINGLFFLGYLAFFLGVESMVMRQFAERALTVSIPEMPISVAIFGLASGCVAACYMGLEAIARSTRISFFFVGALFGLVIVLTFPYWEFSNLTPYLGPGGKKIMASAVMSISMVSEVFLLAVIIPGINNAGRGTIWGLGAKSLFISAGILSVTVLIYSLTFPVPVAREIPLPTFEMARLIYFGRFVQRLEPVFLPMWGLAALLKLTIGLYAMVALLIQMFKLPYYRPLIMPLAVIVISVAFIPANVSIALAVDERIIRNWGWVPTFGLPIILLAVSLWRGKGGTPGAKGN